MCVCACVRVRVRVRMCVCVHACVRARTRKGQKNPTIPICDFPASLFSSPCLAFTVSLYNITRKALQPLLVTTPTTGAGFIPRLYISPFG